MKRWPLNKAQFWEQAPFFRLLLPLIASIAVYPAASFVHDALWLKLTAIVCGTCVAIFTLTAFKKYKSNIAKSVHFFSLTLSLFCFAWLLCYYGDIRNDARWFGKKTNSDFFIARITDVPAEKERTYKLPIKVIGGMEGKQYSPACGSAFLYVYKDEDSAKWHEGDELLIPNNWTLIKNSGNPFEFDYATYCARNNIYYQQFLSGNDIVLYKTGSIADLSFAKRMHIWCNEQLKKYVPGKASLGLIQAMLVGDEDNLDKDLRQAYAETGIIHIVAISGSHLTIFFLVIAFLLGWIRNRKYHWIKYIVAIPLIWFYVLMAGAPPSAVRSALMFSLLGIGFAFEKNTNTLNQLFATAFILLCAQPMWLFSVGFQLSFLAVLSIILFYKPIYKLYSPAYKITKLLWAAICASLAAELLVAPLVIYYFHIFPLFFVIANVAAYLFAGIILIVGMITVALSAMPAVAGVLGKGASVAIDYFDQLVFYFQRWNPQSFKYLSLSILELSVLYIAIISFAQLFIAQKKKVIFTALTACCFFMILLCLDEYHALHQRRLTVYNVNKLNQIELTEGKYYTIIMSDDAIDNQKKLFATNNAHIALHAWRQQYRHGQNECFILGGKKVLILNQLLATTADTFKADYVIVNYDTKKIQPDLIAATFHPEKIILGSNITRRAVEKWKTAAAEAHVSLHAVSADGAFTLDDF